MTLHWHRLGYVTLFALMLLALIVAIGQYDAWYSDQSQDTREKVGLCWFVAITAAILFAVLTVPS
jgi:hypothetical protein